MTKTTTNVIGIIIVILAGIYFFVSYCSFCGNGDETVYLIKDYSDMPYMRNADTPEITMFSDNLLNLRNWVLLS